MYVGCSSKLKTADSCPIKHWEKDNLYIIKDPSCVSGSYWITSKKLNITKSIHLREFSTCSNPIES